MVALWVGGFALLMGQVIPEVQNARRWVATYFSCKKWQEWWLLSQVALPRAIWALAGQWLGQRPSTNVLQGMGVPPGTVSG